jgi:hypothetical protein
MTIATQQTEPQKPWQKGFDIAVINQFKQGFDQSYNKFARSPFTQWIGPKIADSLSKGRLTQVSSTGFIDTHIAKTSTSIVMYFDVVLGKKLKGDRIVNAIAALESDIPAVVNSLKTFTEPTWLFIWEEDPVQKQIASEAGFKKIGVKITSFSEMYGVYFKDASWGIRVHPVVQKAELASMVQLKSLPDFSKEAIALGDRIRELESEFANHYSKYNKSKSWGALAIRGYSSNISMIEKPSCMSAAWQEEHKNENFVLQNTSLLKKLSPEINQILSKFPTQDFDRIRLMRLQPGGGELSRHVDHVEGDSGMSDGRVMRFHIPIITNPKVIFTMWNTNGEEVNQNMKQGETWLFDFRKPHKAVNGGDEIRIHLVIDVIMNAAWRNLIEHSLC